MGYDDDVFYLTYSAAREHVRVVRCCKKSIAEGTSRVQGG
jgi:hypothetical protein